VKKALVLPGGGVKGAFQVGVLLYLIKELGEEYDIITGISVGALNGSFLAQYNKEDLRQAIDDLYDLWLTIDNKRIRKNWFPFGYLHYLWEKSLYDSAPLEEMVDETLDVDKLRNSNIELNVGAQAVGSGEYREFSGRDACIKEAVKASAAFPVFLKRVKIDGDDYVDGGVKETAPLSRAIKMGAEHITILNTGPLQSAKVDLDLSFVEYPLRMIELQGDEIVRDDLAHFLETNQLIKNNQLVGTNKRYIDYYYIEPPRRLVSNALEFNPNSIRSMIRAGYQAAKRMFPKK
jgi:NTE family protein